MGAQGIQECSGDNSKDPKKGPGDKPKPKPKPGRNLPRPGRRPGKNPIRLDQGTGNNLICRGCGKLASGTPSCCGTGGDWKGICGSQEQVVNGQSTYTWVQGINACQAGSLRRS